MLEIGIHFLNPFASASSASGRRRRRSWTALANGGRKIDSQPALIDFDFNSGRNRFGCLSSRWPDSGNSAGSDAIPAAERAVSGGAESVRRCVATPDHQRDPPALHRSRPLAANRSGDLSSNRAASHRCGPAAALDDCRRRSTRAACAKGADGDRSAATS